MKFDLYVRSEGYPAIDSMECVMWVILPTACVFFLADGRFGYNSLYVIKLGLLHNKNWVKILTAAEVL